MFKKFSVGMTLGIVALMSLPASAQNESRPKFQPGMTPGNRIPPQMIGRGSKHNFGNLAEYPNVFRGKDIYKLLDFEPVRRELELVPDQLKGYEEIARKIQDERSRLIQQMNRNRAGMKDLSPEERREKLLAAHKKLNEELEILAEKKKGFLLDHQEERLHQIANNLKFQSLGPYGALADPAVKEELEIDDEQLEKLKETTKKLSDEFEQRVLELKKEYREKVINELKPEQKEKLKEMIGEEFVLVKAKKKEDK